MTSSRRTARAANGLGPIEPDVLYPWDVFRRLTGLGETSLRRARRAGMKEYRWGGRKFILGSDFLEFIRENSGAAPGPAAVDNRCV